MHQHSHMQQPSTFQFGHMITGHHFFTNEPQPRFQFPENNILGFYSPKKLEEYFDDESERPKRRKLNIESHKQNLETLFSRYSNQYESMTKEGQSQFHSDLNLASSDIICLVINWKWGIKKNGSMTKQEFINGMNSFNCENISQLRSKIPSLRLSLQQNHKEFSQFYYFIFTHYLDSGRKVLDLDLAIDLWKIVFADSKFNIELWFSFLREKQQKAISQDTWAMFLEFSETISPDLNNFNFEEAWPVLIDEFVSYLTNTKKGQSLTKKMCTEESICL
eukprot:c3739_g1_i1.p1 GENE.c3739_g1_i1~~c3739_g1_i1.p1  ORF type:complete len:277 (+),score=75.24 c3739_g1_i1:46-876(+)